MFYILVHNTGFMIWNPPIKDVERIMAFINKSKAEGYKELKADDRRELGDRFMLELQEVVRDQKFDAKAFGQYLDETYG